MNPDQKLNEIDGKLTRIESALLGDEMGSIGLVERLIANEKKINTIDSKVEMHKREYEAEKNKRKGMMIVLAAVWSAIVLLINKIL